MDPQAFIRLSVGSLGLRVPTAAPPKVGISTNPLLSVPCLCEIRLRGFPVQTAPVPLIYSAKDSPDPHCNSVFYLEKSHVEALMSHGCFQAAQSYLEVVVYLSRPGCHWGVTGRKQQIGTFRVEVRPEWSEGKPALVHDGWIRFGKSKLGPELHLRVKLDPDPRYVFEFDDQTTLSPQIVQLQGKLRQPIFTCNFSQDRRKTNMDSKVCCSTNPSSSEPNVERRERKGWKVMIYDLSGSAVAVAFISTPFVPSAGCDWVARSNPGAWLILRPDPFCSSESWLPWGRLEAWRESGSRGSVCLRLHLLAQNHEAGFPLSDIMLSAEKGGEFFIDMDRQTPVRGGGGLACEGGFVMCCRVQGEGKSRRPVVHLATRHVTCAEDAAIFMALAAAVDLSMEACRPFGKKARKMGRYSVL